VNDYKKIKNIGCAQKDTRDRNIWISSWFFNQMHWFLFRSL
jgi:hypothetical protein